MPIYRICSWKRHNSKFEEIWVRPWRTILLHNMKWKKIESWNICTRNSREPIFSIFLGIELTIAVLIIIYSYNISLETVQARSVDSSALLILRYRLFLSFPIFVYIAIAPTRVQVKSPFDELIALLRDHFIPKINKCSERAKFWNFDSLLLKIVVWATT